MAKRIFIIGGPNTGKSSLAQEFAARHGIKDVLNTDALIGLGWSEASAEAAKFIDEKGGGDFVLEGCATARALRKWMTNNPGKPLPEGSQVYMLNLPYLPQTKNQQTMTKGMLTVMTEIYGELVARGATFEQPEKSEGDHV
jgi:adenylate kinase family enzyme